MLVVLGDSELVVSQVKSKYVAKHKRLKKYRNYVWDTVDLFDAFSMEWIDRSKNIMADFLANVALRKDDITLARVSQIEFKTRPAVPNNIYSW